MFKNRLMKFTALAATAGLALTACGSDGGGSDDPSGSADSYKIGISQYVNHPSLNAAADGFQEAFKEAGVDVDFDLQIAAAEQGNVNNITSNFANDGNMDMVLAIATPSAITAATTVEDKPVVFAAVTDPVEAGLVEDWDKPGGNVTGVSDMNPVEEQLKLLKELVPDAKTIGLPYSSSEANSKVQVEAAQEAAKKLDLEIKEVTVTNTSEVQQAVASLTGVDAIYVITDNVVVSSLETVISYGEDNQIPVIAAEPDSVARGSVATYGIDYFEHGKQAGEKALEILQDGKEPGDIPVDTAPEDSLETVVNEDAAKAMGVEIPEDILKDARVVTEDDAE